MKSNGRCIAVAALLCLAVAAGCGRDEPAETGAPLVRVNDYVMSTDEFKRRLTASPQLGSDGVLSREEQIRLLRGEIDREILIQVAIKAGIDQEKPFREAIERYWEQTLITTLIKRKGMDVQKRCLVTEEEIKELYSSLKQDNPAIAPLPQCRDDILRRIREEKKQRALDLWLQGLKKSADIEIFEENLSAVR